MSDITCTIERGLATVTLNRPAQRNAMTFAMWREVGDLFGRLGEDRAVRCVVLTGAGSDFSSGADIAEFAAVRDDPAQASTYEEAVDYCCSAIAHLPKPSVAVIRGYCLGGGAHLAMSCDFRFCDMTATFGIPAARLSIVYGIQGTRKLLALVGVSEAKRILFTAGRFDARRGRETGFVDEIEDDPMAAARALAETVAENAPLSIAGAKYILNGSSFSELDAAEALRLIDRAAGSHDYREGRDAFAGKRPARFTGS